MSKKTQAQQPLPPKRVKPKVSEPIETVPYQVDPRESPDLVATLLANQYCSCGHDRVCHGDTIGDVLGRELITNCPRSGSCNVKGCECESFVFSAAKNGSTGLARREKEVKEYDVFPPSEE